MCVGGEILEKQHSEMSQLVESQYEKICERLDRLVPPSNLPRFASEASPKPPPLGLLPSIPHPSRTGRSQSHSTMGCILDFGGPGSEEV